MTEPNDNGGDCLHCIDGMALSESGLLGICFRVCGACQPGCPCCHGNGGFPATTRDMAEFIAHHNDAGYLPVLCHTCGGVVDIHPIDEEPTP